jgi:exosortase/archaeosortase family protein
MISNPALTFTKHIPKDIKVFLIRALVFFIAWKLLYHLLLFPARMPDHQLTTLTAKGASFFYTHLLNENLVLIKEKINPNNGKPYVYVYTPSKKLVGIGDRCNGLELIILYVAFLFCFPLNLKKQIPYVIFGVLGIILLNSLRCFGLTWMYMNDFYYADFFHSYLFKMVIYGLIFLTWVHYSKGALNAKS